MDEAGRGPWAGPVVASAVVLRAARLPTRIDDSKRLTPAQRARAFDLILRHADVGIGVVSAEEIDRRNVLQATLLAMQQAVDDLAIPPDRVLVDGSVAPPLRVPCEAIIHGDQRRYVIACASIVAKVVRDRLMTFYHALYPHYQFHQHKGYGTALHARLLADWGPCVLHRFSFRPIARLHTWANTPGVHEEH